MINFIIVILVENIFLMTLRKTVTELLFKLNFSKKKKALKENAVASLLKHRNDFHFFG